MIAGLRRAFLWNAEQPRAEVPSRVAVPPPLDPHPNSRFLRAVNAPSFAVLGHDAEVHMREGQPPGRIIDDGNTLRAQHYPTAIEAGADAAVVVVEDDVAAAEVMVAERHDATSQAILDRERARLAEAMHYRPLARRWALQSELDGLRRSPVPESAPRAHERRVAAVEPEPVAGDWSVDGNRRSLRAMRDRIEAEHRDHLVEQFQQRQAAAIPDVVNLDDPTGRIVALERLLAEWNVEHPGLLAELKASA